MKNPRLRQRGSPNELRRGFFDRESTLKYIDQLASLDAITLYGGAGVSADLGAPEWKPLMRGVLQRISNREFSSNTVNDSERTALVARVVDVISTIYPPAFLGSVIREIEARQRSRPNPRDPTSKLRRELRSEIEAQEIPGGFLARSLVLLALASVHKGRKATILTGLYDLNIEDAKDGQFEQEFPQLGEYKLVSRGVTEKMPRPREVPVVHLNGILDATCCEGNDPGFVVGEADFFSRYDNQWNVTRAQRWRSKRLQRALEESASIFIGSSLSDSDVLAALATTKNLDHPRYAVLLRPHLPIGESEGVIAPSWDQGTTGPETQWLRVATHFGTNLIGDRYEHLGVIPIFVDFQHQAPQLLREVALKILFGETCGSYMERLHEWGARWESWAGPNAGRRDQTCQEFWRGNLRMARDSIRSTLPHIETDEKLLIEVWLRDHETRSLFLWANSEGVWLEADSAHSAPIPNETVFQAQATFREGRPTSTPVPHARGHWRWCVSTPIVLIEKPWYHLPVGVVNLLSSQENGALRSTQRDPKLLATVSATLQLVARTLLSVALGEPMGDR